MLKDRISKISALLEKDSVPVESYLNSDIVDIFKGVSPEKVTPFMRLLWEEQQKRIRTKHSTQIRYHHAIIKFCLFIAAKSPAAYSQLRMDANDGTGVLILSS